MNIGQLFRTVMGDVQASEPKALELKVGQVVRGVVTQVNSDQEAVVQINGVQVRARLETPLSQGQSTMLQVQPESTAGQIVLKPMESSTVQIAEKSLGDLLKGFEMKDTPANRQALQELHLGQVALTKETVKAYSELRMAIPAGVTEGEWKEAALMAVKRSLPLTPDTVGALHKVMFGRPMDQNLQAFAALAGEQLASGQGGEALPRGVQALLQKAVELIQSLPRMPAEGAGGASSGSGASGGTVPAGAGAGTGGAAAPASGGAAGVVSLPGAPAAAVSGGVGGTPAASGGMPGASPASSAPNGGAAVGGTPPPPSAGSGGSAAAAAGPMAAAAPGAPAASPAGASAPIGGGVNAANGGAPVPPAAAAGTGSGVPAATAAGTGTAAATGAAAVPRAGSASAPAPAPAAVGQEPPQPASAAAAAQQAPAAAAQEPEGAQWLGRLLKTLGVEHEQLLARQSTRGGLELPPHRSADQPQLGGSANPAPAASQSQPELTNTLKHVLLQLSAQDSAPPALREAAQQLVQQITGQQLLLTPDRAAMFAHMTLMIPLRDENGSQTASVHIQSRKGARGELDAGNCRLLFDLNMRTLGNTLVDVQVVDKIVSLKIHNDFPVIGELFEDRREEIRSGLEAIGFQFLSLKTVPYPVPGAAEGVMDDKASSLPTERQGTLSKAASLYSSKPYKGVDFRV